nr:hypothetical protein [Rhizobium phaseoli]
MAAFVPDRLCPALALDQKHAVIGKDDQVHFNWPIMSWKNIAVLCKIPSVRQMLVEFADAFDFPWVHAFTGQVSDLAPSQIAAKSRCGSFISLLIQWRPSEKRMTITLGTFRASGPLEVKKSHSLIGKSLLSIVSAVLLSELRKRSPALGIAANTIG